MAASLLGACAAGGPPSGPPLTAETGTRAEPLTLVGMDDRAVVEALGQPALKRRDRPAQYWLYSDHGCTLGLFLYLDPGTGESRVTYYELHRPDRAQLVADVCGPTLARLVPMGTDAALSEPLAH